MDQDRGRMTLVTAIKKFITERRDFFVYSLICVFVTVIDVIVSRISEIRFPAVVANALGVCTGFVVQYFLCSRKVYRSKTKRTLIVFFLTWLFGLGLASLVIYVVREIIYNGDEGLIAFAVAKGASIVIPFFITYFLRKALISPGSDEKKEEQVSSNA